MNDETIRGALWARLEQEHRDDPHGLVDSVPLRRLHLAVHAVVETQLTHADPPAVSATLSRLMAEGLSRHEAVHAIGDVASEEVIDCLHRGEQYDAKRYVARLRALNAAAVREALEEHEG